MYTTKDAIQNESELQKRVNFLQKPNSKGEIISEPFEELNKVYGLERRLKRYLNLKDYINIFVSDIESLYNNGKISIKELESIEDLINKSLSNNLDRHLVLLRNVECAINNFICNLNHAIEKGHVKEKDFNNIEIMITNIIEERFSKYINPNASAAQQCASKTKINNSSPELAIDRLKGLDANSNLENVAPQTLATFTEVNENGEVITPIPEVNTYNPQPMTGVTVGLEGEVKEPVDDSDEIIKKGIEKMKNKINTLPKELQPLANRLAMENIEVRKGKNSNKVDGVYEVKLFKNNVKLLNTHIYIDSKGALSDNNEVRLYISKNINQINSANSILLADTEKCVEYIFDNKVLDNIQNLGSIPQIPTIDPNMLDINTFVDFFANTTLPCVVNGEIQAGEIDNIIITKFGPCIAKAIEITKNNCRFRIKDFINLNNFKLVSDSSVCNMDGTFVQRPDVRLELREGQLYTNLNSIQC